ncbi:MAG: dTDP-4-dehydrorhamnose 3,5-epimerase family protein [Acidobacteria bacterium]|jgi:dTDP-4-dehydrorhamnose 3,5-epimerase|nr:dTDP-4-dehydrorhamnose 3,5-epimerase family protein [Acidobacteriota bacterium]
MTFVDTPIPGAYVLEATPIPDDRGFFEVGVSRAEFLAHGLNADIAQVNYSFNARAGTLRGLHFQTAPYAEAKVVRCLRGAAFDVILDLRPDSPMFRRWHSVELTAENRRAVYLPEGVAHGFQTLRDDTEVMYTVSSPYTPSHYRGVRWNDPAFNILWPETHTRTMHIRDREYPDFTL